MESEKLKSTQGWFGRAISRSLVLTDSGAKVRENPIIRLEAETSIRSANGVDGFERLAIYNRQYWFRLIACMQETYPCAVHVLGLKTFNEWVMRFLETHPGDSPYLAELDVKFGPFMSNNFRGETRDPVLEAIGHDRAFDQAFTAPEGKPSGIDPNGVLQLAPHATPLWLHWDFSAYRADCNKDEELTGTIPLHPGERGVLIYRHDHRVYEKEIPRSAFLILNSLRTPKTLGEVFRGLESEVTPELTAEMEKNLAGWFQDWVELGWLSATPL